MGAGGGDGGEVELGGGGVAEGVGGVDGEGGVGGLGGQGGEGWVVRGGWWEGWREGLPACPVCRGLHCSRDVNQKRGKTQHDVE